EVGIDVWVAGRTSSTDFPITAGAPQTSYAGGTAEYGDGFVVRLTNTLTATPTIAWGTYLGGSGNDSALCLLPCLGSSTVAVGGWTASTNFPMVGVPLQPVNATTLPPPAGQIGADGFVALYAAWNGALTNTTYLGGASDDLVIDMEEMIFFFPDGLYQPTVATLVASGRTMSSNFPVTPVTALDTTLGGSQDAFLVALTPNLSVQWYGSYLGGSGDEVPSGLARSQAWTGVWVAGQTTSPDFPTTAGCLQPQFGGGSYFGVDGFLTHIDLGVFVPSQLLYSTYLGGPGDDAIMDLEVDAASEFVTAVGLAGSPPFPHTSLGALQPTFQGGGPPPVGPTDGFVVRLDPSQAGAAQLVYGTFLGGAMGQENVMDVALRSNGNAVVTGWTLSGVFPATGSYLGNTDAFVAELSLLPNNVVRYGAPSPAGCAAMHLAVDSAPAPGNTGFEVLVYGALPNAPGVLFLGAPAATAATIPGLGLDVWLQFAPPPVGSAAVFANGGGFARFPVPIPAGYIWGSVGLQAVWVDLGTAPCALLLASDALR
ncbi:MAG TPA: hypothetical protein VFD82_13605, partial [Planctomycetota bacterium]|nr:hypothetical protein [Planctomycetota bacterium]